MGCGRSNEWTPLRRVLAPRAAARAAQPTSADVRPEVRREVGQLRRAARLAAGAPLGEEVRGLVEGARALEAACRGVLGGLVLAVEEVHLRWRARNRLH